jgi:flagellar biosynthesis protein FlhA
VALQIKRPVEFNSFPTLLLLLTLFRLALNVSSSRLILLNGNSGTAAAGHVIEAFGNFVVGGNFIIGAVVFLILCGIQYIVINHGAVRISEVTARFTLDAMPGKQMAIDADLNAGLIDEAVAKQRRKELAGEVEFYGSMDGASRFTQRDSIASLLITAVNILAGFLIGVLQHGMPLTKALQTYTVLTIGDGLVTVIPALMISVAGGLIITRANSDVAFGADVSHQLLGDHRPLFVAGTAMMLLALIPGLPTIPFILLGASLTAYAWRERRRVSDEIVENSTEAPSAPVIEPVEDLLKVELIAIEVGVGLVSFVEGGVRSPLMQRIAGIRRQLASQLGFVLPSVRVTDNLSLRSREYVILLRGAEIARFELAKNQHLAIPSGNQPAPPSGKPAKDPAFGLAAFWIPSNEADAIRAAGFTVVDDVSILSTHFAEIIRRYAHELYSRQDAKTFCDRVTAQSPKLVEDVVPKLLPLATVQRVLQNLLRERVSIRDGSSILEALGEAGAITKNPVLLTEYVRQAIRRTLVKSYVSPKQELHVYYVDTATEQRIEGALEHGENNTILSMAPLDLRDVVARFEQKIEKPATSVVALTSVTTRHHLRQILETEWPHLVVLSHNEVPPEVKVRTIGTI